MKRSGIPILRLIMLLALPAGIAYGQENIIADDGVVKSIHLQAEIEKNNSSYCIPSANCTFGDGISGFVFAGIENLSSGCSTNGFGDFTGMMATVEIGGSYIASFSSNFNNQHASLWIDLNSDSVFSESERFVTDLALEQAGELYDADLKIPVNARPGLYRLRIGSTWEVPSSTDPCAESSYGEWEDYHVEMQGDLVKKNIAVESIRMESIMPAEPLRPFVVVSNTGLDSARFQVYMHEWSTGYESMVQFWNLPPGETKWARFDTLDLPPGKYNISVHSYYDGDKIPEDNFKAKWITFTDQPRQKVITELFTGTWSNTNINAAEGLELLKQEYGDTLGVISWHIGDEFEIPEALERDAWYRIGGYPTAWIDGWVELFGAYVPNNYFYYKPYIKQRVPDPSNFNVSVVLSEMNESTLNVNATIEMPHGNSHRNLAAFVVLTESDLSSPGHEKQDDVVRKIYPDAVTGQPAVFSIQNIFTWDTPVCLEDEYVVENCEIVVFLQDMDTREIFQGNSRMADDITDVSEPPAAPGISVYPNPASEHLTIKSDHQILRASIFNNQGEKVKTLRGKDNMLTLPTARYKSGVYLIQIETFHGIFTHTVVID